MVAWTWELVSGGGSIEATGAAVVYISQEVDVDSEAVLRVTAVVGERSTTQLVTINVADLISANLPPVCLSTPGPFVVDVGESFLFRFEGMFEDPEGEFLSISVLERAPGTGTLITEGGRGYEFTADDIGGMGNITVRAQDPHGLRAFCVVSVTVNPPDPPDPPIDILDDADAPEYGLVPDRYIHTDLTQQINAVLSSSGHYDTIVYVWEVLAGPGTITGNVPGNTATYTAPYVLDGVPVTLRLTVTVHGTGEVARDETSDASEVIVEVFFVVTPYEPRIPRPLPLIAAPEVTISEVDEVAEDSVLSLSAIINGGQYDTLSYAWEIISGGGFLGGSSTHPVYTPPDVAVDTQVEVRVTVTARGNGITTARYTSATATDDELFTVRAIADALPAAVAPAVTIGEVGDIVSGGTQNLEAALDGGTYDEVEYSWDIVIGDDTFPQSSDSSSLEYAAPEVSEDTEVTAICTVNVRGTGGTARAGTLATANDEEDFSVTFVLGAAQAPVVTIAPILSVLEGELVVIRGSYSGGTYDSVLGELTLEYGGGSLADGLEPICDAGEICFAYETPLVDENTPVAVRITLTVFGDGVLALDDTQAAAFAIVTFDVLNIPDVPDIPSTLPSVQAPKVTISSETSINEDETLILTTSVADGFYDTLEYNWVVVFGGGVIAANSSDESTAVYTPPDISADTVVRIRCDVTAHGTGENALDGASAMSSDTEDFTVVALSDLPVANVFISQIQIAFVEAGLYVINVEVSGAYDTITYSWSVPVGTVGGATSQTSWAIPEAYLENRHGLTCNVAVTGTGVNAVSGTSATASGSIIAYVSDSYVLAETP